MPERHPVVLKLGCLADSFFKVNAVNLSLPGKQLTVFVANDKIWALQVKITILEKTCICHLGAWQLH